MKDIQAWQAAVAGEPERVSALLDELAAIAKLPLRQRMALFPFARRAVAHPRPEVRAAAVRAFEGARSYEAIRVSVNALSDEAPVRAAAVASLRAAGAAEPSRFAHALFHPRLEVRRLAVEEPVPVGAQPWLFYLLADPELNATLRERELAVPRTGIFAILHYLESGAVSRDVARAWFLRIPWGETSRWLETAHRRSPDEIDRLRKAEGRVEGAGRDVLDDVFELFLAEDADEAVREGYFRRLSHHLQASPVAFRNRVYVSLLRLAQVGRTLDAHAASLVARWHPEFFKLSWVKAAVRRQAACTLYEFGQLARPGPRNVLELVRGPLGMPGGEPDLEVIGAFLHYLPRDRFALLKEWLGTDALVEAILADVPRAGRLFSVPDRGKAAKATLLPDVVKRAPERSGELYAMLVTTVSVEELSFLRDLTTEAQFKTIGVLLAQEAEAHRKAAPGKAVPGKAVPEKAVPEKAAPAKRTSDHAATLSNERMSRVNRVAVSREIGRVLAAEARRERESNGDRTDRRTPSTVERFLDLWLSLRRPEASELAPAIFGYLSTELVADALLDEIEGLSTPRLRLFLSLLPNAHRVSYGFELGLAHRLSGHVSTTIADWARDRVPPPDARPEVRARSTEPRPLTPAEHEAIRRALPPDLGVAVEPSLRRPSVGLTDALLARSVRPKPSLPVCLALLGSVDPLPKVAELFARFLPNDDLQVLERRAVKVWRGVTGASLLLDAWLYRFEAHAEVAFLALRERGHVKTLVECDDWSAPILRRRVWAATARWLEIVGVRDRKKIGEWIENGLLECAVERLDRDVGPEAARVTSAIARSGTAGKGWMALRDQVRARLPDVSDETRDNLRHVVAVDGLPSRRHGARVARPASPTELEQVRISTDLSALEGWARRKELSLVHEAALRLLLLGAPGERVIVRLLTENPPPPRVAALADAAMMIEGSDVLAGLRAAVENRALDAAHRFRLALCLAPSDRSFAELACAVANADGEVGWFRNKDYRKLCDLLGERVAARALASSPHPHAYIPALELLLDGQHPVAADDRAALRQFLDQGTERMTALRYRAARLLHSYGESYGLPVLLPAALRGEAPGELLFRGASLAEVRTALEAVFLEGSSDVKEWTVHPMLLQAGLDWHELGEAFEQVLEQAAGSHLRKLAIGELDRRAARGVKLRRVAEVFAWGVRVGRGLTARMFRFHMIGSQALGYTRLEGEHIYVTPLPMLRGDRNGREIVEGLVLHEIGHHVHHRGDEEAAVWKEADRNGIGGLLNLVADEHLERNLRALDPSYGDRLKRLAAYAFQHSAREIDMERLLGMLQHHSFSVLSRTRLEVARHPRRVRVENGAILQEMERRGLRFAIFVRALRMGLGKRHGDPLVNEALDLFSKSFRKHDMRELLRISYQLQDMFGWETSLVDDFGGHENLKEDGRETDIFGDGIDDDELQREVERVLNPKKGSGSGRGKGKLQINVNPNEQFQPITEIQRVVPDPAAHRVLVQPLRRHSRAMRAFFTKLGMGYVPVRFRLRGRRFDATRTQAVVTRSDPRMLQARELVVKPDLFFGMVIDCSGSMHGNSMARARAFGGLLAEAARGLRGIDLRIFGFTDRVLYDAGDAARPAVALLEAGGGNNDAAALHHVAGLAKQSQRRSKLLVMISDGLPTECSVAALRALVQQLTKREKMCCAQVAVRPLTEQCFPHYVEIHDDQVDAAVRSFGRICAKLVRTALRG
ncbi:MAG: hypothetical protein AAGF12_22720 [Myxococcota bacterium]